MLSHRKANGLNHPHRKVLHGILAHPLNHNLDPGALEHVLTELGAEMVRAGGGKRITFGGVHLNQHSIQGEETMRLHNR